MGGGQMAKKKKSMQLLEYGRSILKELGLEQPKADIISKPIFEVKPTKQKKSKTKAAMPIWIRCDSCGRGMPCDICNNKKGWWSNNPPKD